MNPKAIYLSIVLICVAPSAISRTRDRPIDPSIPVQGRWEWNFSNDREFNLHNLDFCDYYMVFTRQANSVLPPGVTNIYRRSRRAFRTEPLPEFHVHKGAFPVNFNPDFLYILPMKAGDSTQIRITNNPNEDCNHAFGLVFRVWGYDTVYAVRGGVVSKNHNQGWRCSPRNLEDGRTLLIYHADRTFAFYGGFSETFVNAGERIKAGQPVGLVENRGLMMAFFFLDENKFENGRPVRHPHTYFRPLFHTTAGKTRLELNTTYISLWSDEVFTQEMSNRNKRRQE